MPYKDSYINHFKNFAAVRTLERMGYKYLGGDYWVFDGEVKPPRIVVDESPVKQWIKELS